jgi:hypothetical protein
MALIQNCSTEYPQTLHIQGFTGIGIVYRSVYPLYNDSIADQYSLRDVELFLSVNDNIRGRLVLKMLPLDF